MDFQRVERRQKPLSKGEIDLFQATEDLREKAVYFGEALLASLTGDIRYEQNGAEISDVNDTYDFKTSRTGFWFHPGQTTLEEPQFSLWTVLDKKLITINHLNLGECRFIETPIGENGMPGTSYDEYKPCLEDIKKITKVINRELRSLAGQEVIHELDLVDDVATVIIARETFLETSTHKLDLIETADDIIRLIDGDAI